MHSLLYAVHFVDERWGFEGGVNKSAKKNFDITVQEEYVT